MIPSTAMSRYVPPHLRGREAERGTEEKPVRPVKNQPRAPEEGEFPTLGSSEAGGSSGSSGSSGSKSGAWGSGKRFADLARSWGVEQKEKEEENKRLAKQKATEERLRREQEEKERAFYRVGLARATQLIYRGGRGDEEDAGLYDLGGAKPVEREIVVDDSDLYDPEEEDTRRIETGDWNSRKSRHDLY